MLSIVLLVLKIIGILLLVLLCVLLLVVLTLMFVPLRYKGQGSYVEKPQGRVGLSWLLHIVSVRISYTEELEVVVRLFGIRILKPRTKPQTEMDEEMDPYLSPSLEPMVSAQEVSAPDSLESQEPSRRSETEEGKKQLADIRLTAPKKNIFVRTAEKIKRFFRHMIRSWKRLCDRLKQASDVRQMAMDFIADEKNKKTFRLIIKQGKKVVKHLFPRKIKGYVTFGFDDPYRTGQILTGAAFLYPLYHKQFSVQPVFDRPVFEGEVAFKGRIRMAAILSAGLRILLDKNFRIQLKRFMNRGGM